MIKAIGYVRVSSKEQEREGFSIPAQKKLLVEYAKKKGLQLLKIFEEAETAKRAGRAQFKAMVAYLEGNANVRDVLVEKTDRLYRNFKDYSVLDVENLGLSIHLVKEGEVLSKESKSHQKFIHGIKVLMAKNYSDNLSEECKKGMLEKASQGVWPSCAPIGYLNKLDDHTVIPSPSVAPLIRHAFELAATGQYSLAKLKRKLYEKGLRSQRSKKELSKSALQRVLTNSFYYGTFSWNGKVYNGRHEPIISKHLFDKAQDAMGLVQKPRLTKRDLNFAGVFTCAHCGCSVVGDQKIKKSGKTYTYYHCTNGKKACSNVVYLREQLIELEIAKALNAISIPANIVEWTRQALLESSEEEQKYREASISSLTGRYKMLDSYISRAYDDKLEGTLELHMWESKTTAWKMEQQQIREQLNALEKANTSYFNDGIKLMELASRAGELFKTMNKDERREMLSLVLSNPQIENGSLRYDYKMPFSMFVNVVDLEKWRGRVDEFRTWCLNAIPAVI